MILSSLPLFFQLFFLLFPSEIWPLSIKRNIRHKKFQRQKPVIGIYGDPYPETEFNLTNGTSYPISYVLWLQGFGAEVMAVHQWYTYEELREILDNLDGVLFLGGGRDFNLSANWERKAIYILNYALDYSLPVWGTCQGFQLVSVLLSHNLSLLRNYEYDDSNRLHNMNFTKEAGDSRVLSLFNSENLDILHNQNSTIYNHHDGVFPSDFYSNVNITKIMRIISNSKDAKNKPFVNLIEGVNEHIKIYASQFHPEKTPYKRNNYSLPHTEFTLKTGDLFGMFFVEEARKHMKMTVSGREKLYEKYDFFNIYDRRIHSKFDKKEEEYRFRQGE